MGTGIAPFRPMIQTLLKNGHLGPIGLYCGVRNQNERLYLEEWQVLRHEFPNLHFHFALSQPEAGELIAKETHVQDFLNPEQFGDFTGHFYICGLGDMVRDVRSRLRELGVDKSRLHYERYS